MAYDITLEGKNKEIAERMLLSIAKILERSAILYWLEGGTLLGIRRENRLLPWDNDVDLSLLSSESDKLDDFCDTLSNNGFRVRKRFFEETTNVFKKGDLRMIKIRERKFFGLLKGNVCLDVFVKYTNNDECYWKIGDKTKSVPSKFYQDFKKITFNEFEYSIPKLTDEYLSYRYGDWETPVKDWDTFSDDKAIS